jgi:hypothetical protein
MLISLDRSIAVFLHHTDGPQQQTRRLMGGEDAHWEKIEK